MILIFNKYLIICSLILGLHWAPVFSQKKMVYKKVGELELVMEMLQPAEHDSINKCPAMVFFFGGGWSSGNLNQFINHAQYFSKRGLTCFLVDYRIKSKHHTTPFESLKDAKSAIRYIRNNADEFNIDPSKIIAAGGSAGGHLAAATALIADYNECDEDTSISCIPDALVLYNPVIDNGPGGYGYERILNDYKRFSPLHNIQKGAPPTIIFQGTQDRFIPVETVKYYKMVMDKVGSQCELKLYEGQKHGFFNYKNSKYYLETLKETDMFLQSLGYLSSEQLIEIE